VRGEGQPEGADTGELERKLRHPDGKVAPVGVGCCGGRGDDKGASGSRDCLSFFLGGFVGNIQNLMSEATPQPPFFQSRHVFLNNV